MHKKNLKSQESNSTKHTGDRPPEMVELSDEALSQVRIYDRRGSFSHRLPPRPNAERLFKELHERGLQLITRLKKNLKNKLMLLSDKMRLNQRGIIESVNDQLKNMCQIEHTRYRKVANFMVNLVGGLIAYTYQPQKPSLHDTRPPIYSFS
jgi:hypothetical protein